MPSPAATAPRTGVGPLLREWRRRRRRSQLDLALAAGVSARHISFLETGRSNPSRAMVSASPPTWKCRSAIATSC